MKEKMKIKFMNTLSRKVEIFIPIDVTEVKMYTCGPTVYGIAHIGNMRAYIFADVARKVLEYAGYKVKQVMNITDVGHLTSDADEGEDKLQKSAREQKTSAWEISKKYTAQFFDDASELNIQRAHIICKATDHIQEQIALIKKLEKKGFVYITSDGVYYDTSKFPRYGDLAKLDIEGLRAGQRIDIGEKRNKTDFALWKFSKPKEKRDMDWDSPWGKGFPGWHIECSAMSMKYLGETFDIHTGGIDHIPIHHTNEIAQSEAATGKKFVNYWLHSEFLIFDNEKMSKSSGDFLTLNELIEKEFDPLDYRYFCLGTHYRKPLTFSWDNLTGGKNAFSSLKKEVLKLKKLIGNKKIDSSAKEYDKKFLNWINDDLNIPAALGVVWNLIRDPDISPAKKYSSVIKYDKVLGLNLSSLSEIKEKIPQNIIELADKREIARQNKDWKEADELRNQIYNLGFLIEDTSSGPIVKKR